MADQHAKKLPVKKRSMDTLVFADSSSDEDVISIRSSSEEGSFTTASDDETLNSASDFPIETQRSSLSMSQISAVSAFLATQKGTPAMAVTSVAKKRKTPSPDLPVGGKLTLTTKVPAQKYKKVKQVDPKAPAASVKSQGMTKRASSARKKKKPPKDQTIGMETEPAPKRAPTITNPSSSASSTAVLSVKEAPTASSGPVAQSKLDVATTVEVAGSSEAVKAKEAPVSAKETKSKPKASPKGDSQATAAVAETTKALAKSRTKPANASTKSNTPESTAGNNPAKAADKTVQQMKASSSSAAKTPGATEAAKKSVAKAKPSAEPKPKRMNFQDKVYHHLLKSFKPFMLKQLADELKATETSVNYVMLSLIDKGLVFKKEFTSGKGRTKELYWANHGAKAKEVSVKLATGEEIAAARGEEERVRAELSSMEGVLTAVTSGPSNEDLTVQLAREEQELVALKKRLSDAKERIRSAKLQETTNSRPVVGRAAPTKTSAQEARERCPRRMKMRINNMRGEWKKRKEKCMDFIDQLADGMEKNPREVIKMLELETDEMQGVKIPPKYVIE